MFEVRNGIPILIFFYILFCVGLWYVKPKLMFKNKKMKKFGVGSNKTVFNYQIVIIVSALILFYLFEIVWLKKNNFI
jgi:hypothetical protein